MNCTRSATAISAAFPMARSARRPSPKWPVQPAGDVGNFPDEDLGVQLERQGISRQEWRARAQLPSWPFSKWTINREVSRQTCGARQSSDTDRQPVVDRFDPFAGVCQDGGTNADSLDRKSTRLNSSHLGISYAVF